MDKKIQKSLIADGIVWRKRAVDCTLGMGGRTNLAGALQEYLAGKYDCAVRKVVVLADREGAADVNIQTSESLSMALTAFHEAHTIDSSRLGS